MNRIRRTQNARPCLIAQGVAALLVACTARYSLAQGYAPQEAAAHMQVAEGLSVKLVACEPQVRQPVAIDFDDRGRLWVMQYLQYPNPAGLKRVAWDRYSRTTYDRVPEPPPRGPRGADRLTILTDVDGDGLRETARDFIDGLNLASAFAFGRQGVFVLQVPYLLFYADRDGNDQPDGDPEVLLSGFGMEDAHSVANSLTWGPDGWLYGCQGSTVTSNVRDIEFQQGAWRYQPESHRFELFYEGGGNTWGLDFDSTGELLASTNFGPYVLLHGVQGGYYWKSFGKHGALHNPFAFGYFEHVPHTGSHGGHVSVGGLLYRDRGLPSEWQGRYIAANLLSHDVYWHTLTPVGSTFAGQQQGAVLESNDAWFAPSDLTVGPDGALYVSDWHDQRTAHPDPDADWDRSNGRIYRIAAAEPRLKSAPGEVLGAALSATSSPQLVEWATRDDDWLARRARRLLADRRDPAAKALLLARLHDKDGARRSRRLYALWALAASGQVDLALLRALVDDPQADIRRWAIRLLGDDVMIDSDHQALPTDRLTSLAERESDPRVLVQLAATARRLDAKSGLSIVASIVEHQGGTSDPFLPLMTWWAMERHAPQQIGEALAVVLDDDYQDSALARETLLPRLLRRLAAVESAEAEAAVVRLMEHAWPSTTQNELLAAWDLALVSRPSPTPSGWTACAERLLRASPERLDVRRVAARLGVAVAVESLFASALDSTASTDARQAALALLAELPRADSSRRLLPLLRVETPVAVLQATLAAMRDDLPELQNAMLSTYRTAPPETQVVLRRAIFRRPTWAMHLLAEVDAGRIAPRDIPLAEVPTLAALNRPEIDAIVARHWGRIQPATPEEKLAEARRLNNDLRAAGGDAEMGRAIFRQHCGDCHRLFDEGTTVGPELTTANRHDREYLLLSLVDPSATIRREFLNYVVATHDGRVFTGLLAEQAGGAITLLAAKGERTRVLESEIESLTPSPASLMPERLYEKFSPTELRNLFAYLQSEGPPGAAEPPVGSAARETRP